MIPEHLASTHRMLQSAYPAGLPEADYFALLVLLSEQMCEENLAAVVALAFSREQLVVGNDAAKAVTTHEPNAKDLDRVRSRLRLAGYDDWIHED